MRLSSGWYLPDDDDYFASHFAADPSGFQIDRLAQAIPFCRNLRTAVDGGAHVGTWTTYMARYFQAVYAFEPVYSTFECLQANVRSRNLNNVVTLQSALGETNGTASLAWDKRHKDNGNTGSKFVRMNVNGGGEVVVNRLDDFNIADVDLLKLDVEGAELLALRGAREILEVSRPVVMVEVKPGYGARFGYADDAVEDYLVSLGAREVLRVRADRVFVFD